MKLNTRIIYFGTPDFAVNSLLELVKNYNVVAIVTSPDNVVNKGISISPIKQQAIQLNIPVLQPVNLNDESFISELKSYNANLFIVVAYKILPQSVYNIPKYGSFNLHASYLPDYRGAAPINWVIINGETETGLTTFFLKDKVDTGDIILQEKEPILDTDTYSSLYDKLKVKSANLVIQTVKLIENNEVQLKQQSYSNKLAPKIYKELGRIDFNKSAKQIYNLLRGLSSVYSLYFIHNDKEYKTSKIEIIDKTYQIGECVTDNKTYLYFGTSDKSISILNIQPKGKKSISIIEFFRGYKL